MRAAALFALIPLVAGCTAPADSGPQIAHVHGLAFDASSGALFVATHNGLVRGVNSAGSWSWAYVGEKRYDLMGFSQDGANSSTFYAGGHPGLLGLAKSTDAGVTWASQSFEGKADIHAVTGVPGQAGAVVASWNGMPLVSSSDGGRTWTNLASMPAPAVALAASTDSLFVGTMTGVQVSHDMGRTLTPATSPAPGAVTAVAASGDGKLLLASVSGDTDAVQTFRSTDHGTTWTALTSSGIQGAQYSVVFAADAKDASHAYAATYGAHIEETKDSGATWTTIRQ